MDFVKGQINSNKLIQNKLSKSREAIIATYCFAPGPEVLDALLKIPKLTVIYCQDYLVTNPDSLWKLKSNGKSLFWVPEEEGKWHAKIYYGKLKNNSEFALVCSANMTEPGFNKNQEAGIMFDTSKNKSDLAKIAEIREYLNDVRNEHEKNGFTLTEYEDAKRLRDLAKSANRRSQKRTNEEKDRQNNRNCWIVKTGQRNAQPPEVFHKQFTKYDVIAHGFGKPDQKRNFQRFQEIKEGDFVLMCEGWSNPHKDVPIYGLARIRNGQLRKKRGKHSIDFIDDSDRLFKNWIKFWYETEKVVDLARPQSESSQRLGELLGLGSSELACQKIKNKSGLYILRDCLLQTH